MIHQWHIYVNGKLQPGLVTIEGELVLGVSQVDAVVAWMQNNEHSEDDIIHATAHIQFNERTRRNVSRSPAPAQTPFASSSPRDPSGGEQEPEPEQRLHPGMDDVLGGGDDPDDLIEEHIQRSPFDAQPSE